MREEQTNEAEAIALAALGWILEDASRASRLLALTGLTPEMLRARIGDPALLAAALRFLEGHEPDLVGCANDLGVAPLRLIESRRRLES